jgi:hypothetical protein
MSVKKLMKIILAITIFTNTATAKVIEATGRVPTILEYSYMAIDGGNIAKEAALAPLAFVAAIVTLGMPDALISESCVMFRNQDCKTRKETVHSGTSKVQTHLVLSAWGEGRIKILMQGDDTKGCSGYQISFAGIEKSDGAFEVFSELAPDQSLGELLLTDDLAYFNLKARIDLQTAHKNGQSCNWAILPDTAVKFNIKD